MLRLLMAAALLFAATPAAAGTTTVTSLPEFNAAWKQAPCGDTIAVRGTVSNVVAAAKTCPAANPVTIDTAGATVNGLQVTGSAGVVLTGDGFRELPGLHPYIVQIANSADVTVIGARLVGSGDPARGISRAFEAKSSQRIKLLNSWLSGTTTLANWQEITDAEMRGNILRYGLNDAIDAISIVNFVVDHNDARDWRVPSGSQLHPDGLQGWIVKGIVNKNWTITNNVMIGPIQGLFLCVGPSPLPDMYQGLLIAGNRIMAATLRGISVFNGSNVAINDNEVGADPAGYTYEPGIVAEAMISGSVNRNTVWRAKAWNPLYVIDTNRAPTMAKGANTIRIGAMPVPVDPLTPPAPVQNAAALKAWLAAAPLVTDPALAAALKAAAALVP